MKAKTINMEFMAITFTTAPIIRYAHIFEAESASWNLLAHDNVIELTSIEKGGLILNDISSENNVVLKEGNVYSILHKSYLVETTGSFHRHITFAITPDKVSDIISANDVLEMSVSINNNDELTAILPILFEEADASTMSLKIKRAVDMFHSGDTFRSVKSAALLLDILSFATTRSVEMAQKEISGIRRYNHTFYCQQAMRYIANHIKEPINVDEIAESMNVSYGHLSRLFKKQTNYTLVDYINKEKVRKMEELLWSKKMSVSDVAQSVGITDEKYASRLFRRYTGLTVSSYINLYKK